jgi:ribosomal protein S12 methylthiotransferase
MNIKDGLVKLLAQLETIDTLKWIRLMYLYPSEISDELIEAIAASERIVNYIDMPIQHINDQILRSMRRTDRKEKTMALIENLRKTMGDVALRTTIIAGLPGETDEQFEELLDFVKWARFDALGCFTYYPESGTPAAEMEAQVPEETKIHRADAIMLAQQQIAFEKAEAKIGADITLLVDSVNENTAIGRSFAQAPEIDSVCLIENCTALPGQFINAKVIGTKDYDLITEQINS